MWIGWTVVLLILIPLFAWAWRHFGDGDTPFPWSFALGFGAAQLTFMEALGTSMAWLPRMSSLPAESLRPGTDRFRRDLALALALDLAPSVLLFATVEALATNLDRQNHVNWAGLPTSFAILLDPGHRRNDRTRLGSRGTASLAGGLHPGGRRIRHRGGRPLPGGERPSTAEVCKPDLPIRRYFSPPCSGSSGFRSCWPG